MKIALFLFVFNMAMSCQSQSDVETQLIFTNDLENFQNLDQLKDQLQGVEIIALGENTHGFGKVFKLKVDLVKFLHEQLGFDLVLFESGYGDGAMAWEKIDSLSSEEFTKSFTSNFYYHSKEIKDLVDYTKSQRVHPLIIQGFDCQPQQDFLAKRLSEIIGIVDTSLSKTIQSELRNFNNLYQFESEGDTFKFDNQKKKFIQVVVNCQLVLKENRTRLSTNGVSNSELTALDKSLSIFIKTYSGVEFGDLMGWPKAADLRDKAMFDIVKWFKDQNPDQKIIIWGQNSHIENTPKPNNAAKWMGHHLKEEYGDKYYSIGAEVYSGKSLTYNGTFEFEYNDPDYLVYHLNKLGKEEFIIGLRNYKKSDFLSQELLGMENNGNIGRFVATDRFDGLLFVKYSGVPILIEE